MKLPPNQKRERTRKKRLKGHGPEHTQYTRLHIYIYKTYAIDIDSILYNHPHFITGKRLPKQGETECKLYHLPNPTNDFLFC